MRSVRNRGPEEKGDEKGDRYFTFIFSSLGKKCHYYATISLETKCF